MSKVTIKRTENRFGKCVMREREVVGNRSRDGWREKEADTGGD